MPRIRSPRRTLITLLAVALLMVIIAAPAGAAPRTTLSWNSPSCTDSGPQAALTATGNGRWAQIEVQVATDGSSPLTVFAGRVEKDVAVAFMFPGDEVAFQARLVRKNGTPVSEWSSTFVDCSA